MEPLASPRRAKPSVSLPRKRESKKKEKSVFSGFPLTREQARIPDHAGMTHRPLHSANVVRRNKVLDSCLRRNRPGFPPAREWHF